MVSKQFQYVLTLANAGTFSRAAEELNISQPSLSQYIKKIENQLNITLFDRNNGNVRLTDAGAVYVEYGRRILDLENQMESRFHDIRQCKSGTIRLGISAYRSMSLMPAVVAEFKRTHPGYCVILDERPRSVLAEAAEHGEFDLCVTTPPVDQRVFCIEPLFQEALVLAVPKDSSLRQQLCFEDGKVDLRSTDGADFVVLHPEHPMQVELETLITTYDLSIQRTVECKSLDTMLSMVSAGMGMALVPISLKNCMNTGIEFLPIMQDVPKREIIVIYRKEQYLNESVIAFKDLMKRMIKNLWN